MRERESEREREVESVKGSHHVGTPPRPPESRRYPPPETEYDEMLG